MAFNPAPNYYHVEHTQTIFQKVGREEIGIGQIQFPYQIQIPSTEKKEIT